MTPGDDASFCAKLVRNLKDDIKITWEIAGKVVEPSDKYKVSKRIEYTK